MDTYKWFLQDLVVLLKEKLKHSKTNQIGNDQFEEGFRMGIYETLDLIKSQADSFGISLQELGIENLRLE
ncbi:hypothetical protein, partial [Leptospira weilii]|uniref:hypothetical protein n=1 Tax=Leptospira weilii TaxID=28184 RepID=UPI0007730814